MADGEDLAMTPFLKEIEQHATSGRWYCVSTMTDAVRYDAGFWLSSIYNMYCHRTANQRVLHVWHAGRT